MYGTLRLLCFFFSMKIAMIPQLNQLNRAELKRDGLALFSKLIRTKNVESMQGEALHVSSESQDPKKVKLKVSSPTVC
jgi:hypothetical protein